MVLSKPFQVIIAERYFRGLYKSFVRRPRIAQVVT
jgi:hypothetical protein